MRRSVAWLVLFVLLLAGNHLLRAWLDTRPPAWDRAVHLHTALRCADRLGDGAGREILRLSGYYAPLVHCAGGLLHRLLGPAPLVSLLVTQTALALVVLGTYRVAVVALARRWWASAPACLDAQQVVVRHVRVGEDDLARALAGVLPRDAQPRVQIEAGRVRVEGRLHGVDVAVRVVPDLDPAGGTLAI